MRIIKKQFIILALRNLARYRTRNLLTGISIALGTTAIISGLSFTNGIIRQTIIGFTGTLVEDVMAFPSTAQAFQKREADAANPIDDTKDGSEENPLAFVQLLFESKDPILREYQQIERSILDIDGIDYVTKKVQFTGTLFSDTSNGNAMILGMEPEGIRRKENLQIEKGRYLHEDDWLSLIISEKLAGRLKVDVGDKLAVVVNMPQGGTNAKDFRIEGIFSIKTGLEFVNHLIYISLWDAQDLMGLTSNEVYSLGVYLRDVDAVDHFEAKIREKVERDNLVCQIYSWKKVMKGILAQYYLIKYIVFIFTIILLLIVCVGVVNSVFLSITERTREIGTIMAMGANRKTIVKLFMLEGGILSLFSATFGTSLGISIALIFKKIGFEAPTQGAAHLFGGKVLYPYLELSTIIFSFCFVIAVTLIGILYPVIKTSRMEPTEALGYV